jgi:hypothetical protein
VETLASPTLDGTGTTDRRCLRGVHCPSGSDGIPVYTGPRPGAGHPKNSSKAAKKRHEHHRGSERGYLYLFTKDITKVQASVW